MGGMGMWWGVSETPSVSSRPYLFVWGNNDVRRDYKGRFCRVVSRGGMSSVLVEFENGERILTSKRALRKVEPAPTIPWKP